VHKAAQGDVGAFEKLILLYQDRVYTHCVNLAGNYDDGQDLAQEVFIRAYRGISNFRGESDFGTWLHKITVNCWINTKKNSRLQLMSIDEPRLGEEGDISREIMDDDETPIETLERKEFNEMLRRALDNLTPEYSAVLVLREMEGYSYQEIADITESSLGTVKSRINRAKRDLRQQMQGLLGSDGNGLPESK